MCSPEDDVGKQVELTDSSVSLLVQKEDVEKRDSQEKENAEIVVSNHVAQSTNGEEVLCKAAQEEEGPKEVIEVLAIIVKNVSESTRKMQNKKKFILDFNSNFKKFIAC